MWRGGLGAAYLFPPLSSGGASIASPCSVSTSRSSNRTCGFPASGSPTAVAFRHTPLRLHLKAKLVPGSPRLALEVIGLRHSPDLCSLPKRGRSQAPSLRRHYPASSVIRACPPPHTARPGPRGLPVGDTTPPMGLPVLRRISLYTCRRHYPGLPASLGQAGGTVGCARCSLPQRRRPSPKFRRVGSRIALFEACSAFTHVTACILAESPCDPLHRRLRRFRCLRPRSGCFRLEQHLSGGTLTHWRSAPFHGALNYSG